MAQSRRSRKPNARKRAIRLLKQGRSARSVAATIGVHRNTVNAWRKAAQLPAGGARLERVVAQVRRLLPAERAVLAHTLKTLEPFAEKEQGQ